MKRHFTLIVVSCIWLQRGVGGVVWDSMESKKRNVIKKRNRKEKKRIEMKTLEEREKMREYWLQYFKDTMATQIQFFSFLYIPSIRYGLFMPL